MRGIAAIAVAVMHYDAALLPCGYLAVDFFFMLSGFVLASRYDQPLADGLGLMRFLAIRLVRLYPVYAVGTAFGASIALYLVLRHAPGQLALAPFAGSLLVNAAMLPSPFSADLYPFDLAAWSLLYELIANILLATVFLRMDRLFLVIFVLASGLMLVAATSGDMDVSWGDNWTSWPVAVARTAFGFGCGVLISRTVPRRSTVNRTLAMSACLLLLAVFTIPAPREWRTPIDQVIVFLLWPAILIFGSRIEPFGRIGKLMMFLGSISYGLYLTHLPLVYMFRRLAFRVEIDEFALIPLFVLFAIATAVLALKLVDLPGRRLLGRLLLG